MLFNENNICFPPKSWKYKDKLLATRSYNTVILNQVINKI